MRQRTDKFSGCASGRIRAFSPPHFRQATGHPRRTSGERPLRTARWNEDEINILPAGWIYPTTLLVLAFTAPGQAADQAAGEPVAGKDGKFLSGHGLDLNIYGLAWHPDRDQAHRLSLDNEFNPGLGVHYEIFDHGHGITFAQAGVYDDSGSNWAKFAALGYQFRLGKRLKIGAALALMHSETYNDGAGFVGMIPLVTWDAGRVKLNAVYFPEFGNLNEVDAFGFYLSIPLQDPK